MTMQTQLYCKWPIQDYALETPYICQCRQAIVYCKFCAWVQNCMEWIAADHQNCRAIDSELELERQVQVERHWYLDASFARTCWREGCRKGQCSQAVVFKCIHSTGEFGSRMARDVHHRHRRSIGTPCADPGSAALLLFTAHADMTSGILHQHHAGTLGESLRTFGHCAIDK